MTPEKFVEGLEWKSPEKGELVCRDGERVYHVIVNRTFFKPSPGIYEVLVSCPARMVRKHIGNLLDRYRAVYAYTVGEGRDAHETWMVHVNELETALEVYDALGLRLSFSDMMMLVHVFPPEPELLFSFYNSYEVNLLPDDNKSESGTYLVTSTRVSHCIGSLTELDSKNFMKLMTRHRKTDFYLELRLTLRDLKDYMRTCFPNCLKQVV